jgi:DNA-binding transcriptional ArsR family regulator
MYIISMGVTDVEELKNELDEVRVLKETLKEEIDELRRDRRRVYRRPRMLEVRVPKIDFSEITDSLEAMMAEIAEQLRESMKGIEDIGDRIRSSRPYLTRLSKRGKSEIDSIPPDRIAKVISPLGNEERLKIIDHLTKGPKTFNELEEYTSRTGSSLTHHLTPLLDAGYVVKGEVRGTYYVTVEGRLAYHLSQWLTSRLEREMDRNSGRSDKEPPTQEEETDTA